jgi:hypothetical protein
MTIRTKIQPFLFYRDIVIAVVCAVFGIWGWYDYSVSIPRREAAFQEFVQLRDAREAFERRAEAKETLSAADQAELQRVNATLNERFREVPAEPGAFDKNVQLWVYVVGCGILGTPYAVWSLLSLRKRRFEVTEDGMLRTPEGSCPIDEVRDIDMSRWMSKSIATATLANGATSLMDDYKYKYTHLIVGAIAHRLYPDQWTPEAKVVKRKAEASPEPTAVQ